jgi:hypothetical protein
VADRRSYGIHNHKVSSLADLLLRFACKDGRIRQIFHPLQTFPLKKMGQKRHQ